jgi:hypothetical protein
LESDVPLTREEANEIRDEYIENIQDPAKKKETYFMLQEKVTLVDPEYFKSMVADENKNKNISRLQEMLKNKELNT